MPKIDGRPRLVAVCGIDGAGKSTLAQRLVAEGPYPGGQRIKKTQRQAITAVVDAWVGPRDWAKGPFAQVAAAATAFDFLWHYQHVIVQALPVGDVVCDRYELCYRAYARAVGLQLDLELLFRPVRKADVLIYVDVPVSVAVERQRARGAAGEDEQPEVMHAFSRAYQELLESVESPVLTLDGRLDADAVYREALVQLTRSLG